MSQGDAALRKLQDYVETISTKKYNIGASAGTRAYESGLNNTSSELRKQLSQERAESERVRT